jgi:hypothetical protein
MSRLVGASLVALSLSCASPKNPSAVEGCVIEPTDPPSAFDWDPLPLVGKPLPGAPVPGSEARVAFALHYVHESGFEDGPMYALESAYVMSGDPKLLLLLARGYTYLHRYPQGLAAIRRYLTLEGTPTEEAREQVSEALARIEPNVASLTITCDRARGVVELDGEALGTCPFTRSLPISAWNRRRTLAVREPRCEASPSFAPTARYAFRIR